MQLECEFFAESLADWRPGSALWEAPVSRFQLTWNLPAVSRNSAPRIPLWLGEQRMLSSETNQTQATCEGASLLSKEPSDQRPGAGPGATLRGRGGVLQPQQARGWVLDFGYHFVVMSTWAISLTLTSYLSIKVGGVESVFSNAQGAREIQGVSLSFQNDEQKACSTETLCLRAWQHRLMEAHFLHSGLERFKLRTVTLVVPC